MAGFFAFFAGLFTNHTSTSNNTSYSNINNTSYINCTSIADKIADQDDPVAGFFAFFAGLYTNHTSTSNNTSYSNINNTSYINSTSIADKIADQDDPSVNFFAFFATLYIMLGILCIIAFFLGRYIHRSLRPRYFIPVFILVFCTCLMADDDQNKLDLMVIIADLTYLLLSFVILTVYVKSYEYQAIGYDYTRRRYVETNTTRFELFNCNRTLPEFMCTCANESLYEYYRDSCCADCTGEYPVLICYPLASLSLLVAYRSNFVYLYT